MQEIIAALASFLLIEPLQADVPNGWPRPVRPPGGRVRGDGLCQGGHSHHHRAHRKRPLVARFHAVWLWMDPAEPGATGE